VSGVRPAVGGAEEVSAESIPFKNPPAESAERLTRDLAQADAALCERVASLLKGLVRNGADIRLTVQVAGSTISVSLDPPVHRWVLEGPKLIRSR
jgi:hypothetical protein